MAGGTLSTRGYCIPKEQCDVASIVKELTVSPYVPKGYDIGPKVVFKLYLESESKLYLPKCYGLERFGPPKVNKLPPSQGLGPKVTFKGSLRLEQEEPVNKMLEACRDPRRMGGILNVFCGGGKTTMALSIAVSLGRKTLIVVHKDFLLEQWKERIEQFVPDARVGLIKAKTVDTGNKDIVLASLQSLAMKDYSDGTLADFGTVVVDECFPYEQVVVTDQGPKPIGDLYNLWKNGGKCPMIKSYNVNSHVFEWKRLTYAWEKQADTLLELVFEGDVTVKCTPNHKILTPNGMVKACCLSIGDTVLGLNGKTRLTDTRNGEMHSNNVYDIEVEENHTFVCCNFVCCNQDESKGVIVSNCHHTSAEVFSKALAKICFRCTIGLTATAIRKDGLTKVFQWYLGPIVHKAEKRIDCAEYKVIEYYDSDPLYNEEPTILGSKPNLSKMLNNVCDWEPRNTVILQEVQKVLGKEPGRKLLVLSDRRNHLVTLHELFCTAGYDTGIYMGGMKQTVLIECGTKQIILATYAIASEGYDQKGLDTLLLASPRSDIVQSVGRILRDKPEDRKHTPLVIDIVDTFSIFERQGKKRQDYYQKCGWNKLE